MRELGGPRLCDRKTEMQGSRNSKEFAGKAEKAGENQEGKESRESTESRDSSVAGNAGKPGSLQAWPLGPRALEPAGVWAREQEFNYASLTGQTACVRPALALAHPRRLFV